MTSIRIATTPLRIATTPIRIATTTVASAEEADRLARLALDAHLAACVQILPGVRSLYHWQGKIEDSAELLILFKTCNDKLDALREAILAVHSYQTPEFLVLSVESASAAYQEWLLAALNGPDIPNLVS